MTSTPPSSPGSDRGPHALSTTDPEDQGAAGRAQRSADVTALRAKADRLLHEVRRRMAEHVGSDVQRALACLDIDLQAETEVAVAARWGELAGAQLGVDGQFVRYAPPLYLVTLLQSWPEAFMDGRVFATSYDSSSASARRVTLARVGGYLNDLAVFCTPSRPQSRGELRRTELSVDLLRHELAPDLP